MLNIWGGILVLRNHSSAPNFARAKQVIFFFIIFSLLAFFPACTSQQIKYQALSHNQAISVAADKILLANILRSSEGLPVDHTSITDYKAKENVSGSLGFNLPFGIDAARAFIANPKMDMGPGIESIEMKNFSQLPKSFPKLTTEADQTYMLRLIELGWPPRLVQTFVFQDIYIREGIWPDLRDRFLEKCRKAKKNNVGNTYCNRVKALLKICPDKFNKIFDRRFKEFRQVNIGHNRCEFLSFQAILDIAFVTGIEIDIALKGKRAPVDINDKRLKPIFDREKKKLSGKGRVPIKILFRSTDQMVSFIGQVARAQLHLDDTWTPDIYMQGIKNEKPVPIFRIEKSQLFNNSEGVSVSYKGKHYTVPLSNYNKRYSHYSMEIFSQLRKRIQAAIAEVDIPASNTVILR